MENKVLSTVKKYNLISPMDTVIVGLSGGADSVSLILCLYNLKEKLKINKIIACHINHNLRETALRDEEFSRKLCEKLGIDFYVKSVDIKKIKNELKVCEEEAGRIARYDFFNEIKSKTGALKIATAHHMGDVLETFFIRLLRGASTDGLISIKPMREDGVIRPLIEVKREEIEEYLKLKNQSYVTDETNLETNYLRNKVRLELIPYLKENFSLKEENIINTVELLKKDSEYITSLANKVLNQGVIKDKEVIYDINLLNSLEDAVLSRVIRLTIKKLFDIDLLKVQTDSAIALIRNKNTGKEISFKNEVIIKISYDKVIITKRKEPYKDYLYKLSLGDNYIKEAKVILNLSSGEKRGKNSVLVSDISNLNVRNRKPGDKVYIKKVGHKKVQDLFTDKKVPKDERDIYPIVTDDKGILWIPGIFKRESDERGYLLEIRRMGNEE
ncbi:MAG: tRNA lysidine(34) synthetase TilS [Ruminococcaceae bacterium]|nr:tRNA lysidine(34) synthetase TilS [Oscillospiraceae bacterium]